MKAFKYENVDKRLNKKSQKQINEEKMRQNFLRLYDDIPSDPKMEQYCQQTKLLFDEHCKNNRYYSYQLPQKDQPESGSSSVYRVEGIKKLSNYKMPYKREPQVMPKVQLGGQQQRREKERKKIMYEKFRTNIKLIVKKMKKMKLTMEDIMSNQLFSTEPYRFGSEIFQAVKEGNTEKVWRLLIQKRFSIFSVDNTRKTPLIWSCIRNQPKITKLLIEHYANINKKDINGQDALSYAIKYNHGECVKLLMLSLAAVDQEHLSIVDGSEEKVRGVFNLGMSLMKYFKKLDYPKREELFDEQFRCMNK